MAFHPSVCEEPGEPEEAVELLYMMAGTVPSTSEIFEKSNRLDINTAQFKPASSSWETVADFMGLKPAGY